MKREVEGDAFFPPFEDKFDLVEEIRDDAGVQDSALPAQVAAGMKSVASVLCADRNGIDARRLDATKQKQAGRCRPACRELNLKLGRLFLCLPASPRRRRRRRAAGPRGLRPA